VHRSLFEVEDSALEAEALSRGVSVEDAFFCPRSPVGGGDEGGGRRVSQQQLLNSTATLCIFGVAAWLGYTFLFHGKKK